MPDYTDVPISSFPDAQSVDASDKVTGLKNGANTNFSFNSILAWLVSQFYAVFLPASSKGAAGGVASLDSTGKLPSNQLPTITPSDIGAQDKITASGILKGDGAGGVSAAVAGTDYQAPLTAGTDYATPAQLSDKANQAQLAYVETGTTASRTYAVGEYFCWNGLLYRVTSAISNGGTITPGANCEQVTEGIGNSLQAISTTSITPTSVNPLPSGITGSVFVTRIGKLRFVNLYNIVLASFSPGATICTLEQGDRPNTGYRGDYTAQLSARSAGNWVQATQKVCFVRAQGNGSITLYGDYTAGWYITGTLILIAEG